MASIFFKTPDELKIENFLQSDKKCALVTGKQSFQNHLRVIKVIEKQFEHSHVLLRINKIGEVKNIFAPITFDSPVAFGRKYDVNGVCFEIDSAFDSLSWSKTSKQFNFAIVYPINNIIRGNGTKAIKNLFTDKNVNKIFLCTDTNHDEHRYFMISEYCTMQIEFDN